MRNPVVNGDLATCGHSAFGLSNVLIEGRGACIIGTSPAGGVIIGPGAPKVRIAGIPISLAGDAITPHGKSPHSSAVTISSITKVIVP